MFQKRRIRLTTFTMCLAIGTWSLHCMGESPAERKTRILWRVTIETVPVGNPGNKGELSGRDAGGLGPSAIVGDVPYEYRIGKYEVTNAQYVEFLNAVDPTGANTLELYSDLMSSGKNGGIKFNKSAANSSKYETKPDRDNNPVVYVTWYDAVRFVNWLHNGQRSGNTETGAYTLLGGTPTPRNGPSIRRNPGARWFLPTENEWYKAAYHKNDGVTDNYWDFPTSTDDVPYSDQPPGNDAPTQSNTANFFKDDSTENGYNDGVAVTASPDFSINVNMLTDVGAYQQSVSPYGTFDQGGNVSEWNETLITRHVTRGEKQVTIARHGARGGMWTHDSSCLAAAARGCGSPAGPADRGFRVASIIGEPRHNSRKK